MEKDIKEILLSGIEVAFRDTGRDKVCRIFIPNDNRMFDKFSRTLNQTMQQEWKVFEENWESGIRAAMDENWFARFLHCQMLAQELYHYGLGNEKSEQKEEKFLEKLLEQTEQYVAECGDETYTFQKFVAMWDNGDRKESEISEIFRLLTPDEKEMFRDFYKMVLRVVGKVIVEITPKANSHRIEQITGTEEEICHQVLYNLANEKMENDEMWWHVRYCIDHEVKECTDLMVNLARNGQWKAWVRQAAVEYGCRFMDGEEVCERLLSGLYGKLFYWAVVQLIGSQNKHLRKILDDYAEYYTGQEGLRDACLVKMQDLTAVRRIRRYLARMRRAPGFVENPDPISVIGDIRSIELLDELGEFVDLLARDNFRDRKWNGLQVSLIAAFSNVASSGPQAKEQVFCLLDKKIECCHKIWQEFQVENDKKQEGEMVSEGEPALRQKEWNNSDDSKAQGLSKKHIECICLAEDIRWRVARKIVL